MFTVLSPAKKLLNFTKPYTDYSSIPQFSDKSRQLIHILKHKSEKDIQQLMRLSPSLAKLNRERYQAFNAAEPAVSSSYPAIYLFQGDVYQSLQAKNWDVPTINFAQDHLGILSGLYGLLRPLDRIQAYRLEMGTRLTNPAGATLYDFWQDTLTHSIEDILFQHKEPFLINLASAEYFKAINDQKLRTPVLHIHFLEEKNGQQKVIGLYAKKARGMMARYMMLQRIDTPKLLQNFNEGGYIFDTLQSDTNHYVFVRQH